MGKFYVVFSSWNLLAISLALNVSLLIRLVHESGKEGLCGGDNDVGVLQQAHFSQNNGLSLTLSQQSGGSSSFLKNTNGSGGDDDGSVTINVDHGDPVMYERYWQQMGDKATLVIPGWQSISYFSDINNVCWFLEPEFATEVVRLHRIVGNAVAQGRHIVVGTGSTQLLQAILYAVSRDAVEPINVVSAAPYYSCYPSITDCLKSGLHKWAGDAMTFRKEGPFIEIVTSPNNPDGFSRESMVNSTEGILVHDLAYYWPQYTPITSPADHDIMLFTVSKSTGHAGMRIGWALVKDLEVAKRMVKFIELLTIGVSKDSQRRAAKVLRVVSDSCEHPTYGEESLFKFGYDNMEERWKSLRRAVFQRRHIFSLPEFSERFCMYNRQAFATQPAFAWLKCEDPIEDCEAFLRSHKILTRGGKHFGVSAQYVRVSMLDRDDNFRLFVKRLSKIDL